MANVQFNLEGDRKMSWLTRLLGGKEISHGVSPLVLALLDELEKRLAPEAAAILQKQRACIGCTYWSYKNNEASFGLQPPPGESQYNIVGPCFPTESHGVMATAAFQAPGSESRYTVDYILTGGTLGAMVFDKTPASSVFKATNVVIKDFKLNFNPMASKRVRPEGRTVMEIADLTGWVRDLAVRHRAQNLQFPFNEEELTARLAEFDTTFPPELKEILLQTDGISFEDTIDIFPITEIYDVDLEEDGLFYVMGQFHPLSDPAYLLVKKGNNESTLYRGDMENVHPVKLGTSLKTILHDTFSRTEGKAS